MTIALSISLKTLKISNQHEKNFLGAKTKKKTKQANNASFSTKDFPHLNIDPTKEDRTTPPPGDKPGKFKYR